MKYWLILPILTVLLTGCGTVQIDAAKTVAAACPDLRIYSPAMQKKVACEIIKNRALMPETMKMMNDYQDARDQTRICRSISVPKKPKKQIPVCLK